MGPEFPPARDSQEHRLWEEVLRPLSRELRSRAPALSIEVVAAIRQQFPELFSVDGSFEENRAASEANIALVAQTIEEGTDVGTFELPEPAAAYTHDAVHRGTPLAALHRSIRLGHAAVWRWCDAWLQQHVQDHADVLAASSLTAAWLFAIVDTLSNAIGTAYTVERERWLRTAAAVRTDTIAAILDGRESDSQSASRRLRHELDREHLALIAWVDAAEEGGDTFSALETAVEVLGGATGAGGTISQPSGLLAIEAWLSYSSAPDLDLLDRLQLDTSNTPEVRMAVGEPGGGIAGFRMSHEQAMQARRVATLMRRRAGSVTRYGRVALQAMASADMDQARAFVRRELAELAARDDTSMRLAATLQIYLDEHASRTRTARRLGVHENTISYRIRQVEDILGRGLSDDTLGLRVALAIAPVLRQDEDGEPAPA